MAHADRTLDTSASPQRVWEIWSRPQSWADWNPDVRSASLDGPLAVGTTGTLVTKQGTHRIRITTVEPERSFALEASPAPGMRMSFTCRVEPQPRGSRIGQSVDVGGPLGSLVGGPMVKQVAASFEPILAALKTKAEAPAG